MSNTNIGETIITFLYSLMFIFNFSILIFRLCIPYLPHHQNPRVPLVFSFVFSSIEVFYLLDLLTCTHFHIQHLYLQKGIKTTIFFLKIYISYYSFSHNFNNFFTVLAFLIVILSLIFVLAVFIHQVDFL